jgi:hypothetical protein
MDSTLSLSSNTGKVSKEEALDTITRMRQGIHTRAGVENNVGQVFSFLLTYHHKNGDTESALILVCNDGKKGVRERLSLTKNGIPNILSNHTYQGVIDAMLGITPSDAVYTVGHIMRTRVEDTNPMHGFR